MKRDKEAETTDTVSWKPSFYIYIYIYGSCKGFRMINAKFMEKWAALVC